MKVDLIDGGALFTLDNGETVRIFFQDEMGVEGYKLKVLATQRVLIVPDANNACTITTPKALAILERKIEQVVRERKARTGS